MSWLFLAIAIAGDVLGTAALVRASRSRYHRYLAAATAFYLVAVYAFARSLEGLPTSVADAVYFAAATTFVAIVGVLFFRDRLTVRKVLALVLVVAGVVALRLETDHG